MAAKKTIQIIDKGSTNLILCSGKEPGLKSFLKGQQSWGQLNLLQHGVPHSRHYNRKTT